MQVTMTVNGEAVHPRVEPRLLLVHFLRDELGLTGTHWGCDTSNCGVCVVSDGRRAGEELHRARRPWPTATRSARSRASSATASSTRCSRAS